ncbi:MAG TPA: phage holin family protein [Solirubrobacteraceae bacterium]|nr:phage holin family protein [Solirubrobacteraceae bacterium]
MPPENGQPSDFGTTVTQVSERMSVLVREEIELAKAEIMIKVKSLARGTVAVAAGAVFGVFMIVMAVQTLAWGLDAVIGNVAGDIWIGFAITTGILALMAIGAFLFAWRKLRVGAPTPKMAIDEAKKIRETVSTGAEVGG